MAFAGGLNLRILTFFFILIEYDYAGLQDGDTCVCGNDGYDNFGRAEDGDCSDPCEGDEFEHCGGPAANAVYKTSLSQFIKGPSE